jgi:dTDP-4-dehydrorhamnose 3,5-epimerase
LLFSKTGIAGVYTIDPEPVRDIRGFFARSFCQEEFRHQKLNNRIVQCSISQNKTRGTLRGLHYQTSPHEEEKIVSCTRGSIYDVILDLRRESTTCYQWFAVELTADNFRMLYIPKGCAHGFQTLEDNSVVYYQMTGSFHPESARSVRYNDPKFAIEWPVDKKIISEKDRKIPDYSL